MLTARSCKQGFVWCESFCGDFVCTAPEVATIVKCENNVGRGRADKIVLRARQGSSQCGKYAFATSAGYGTLAIGLDLSKSADHLVGQQSGLRSGRGTRGICS